MAAARAAAASRARRAARSAGGARRTRPAAAAAAIPPQQPPQVVLFDLDGVLYDAPRTGYLEDVKRRQVEFIVERLGVPRADAPALQQEAFALANQTARGLQRMGFAFESKEFVAYCRQGGAPKYLKPDDEVIEAVRALSVPALVFTNTGEREAEVCLECLGLDEPGLFQGIVGSDSYSEPKPNRAAFEVALGRAGLSLEEAHRGARAHALAHAVRARGWTLCGHASGGCCNRPPSLAAMC